MTSAKWTWSYGTSVRTPALQALSSNPNSIKKKRVTVELQIDEAI
jgi:hypothetical protein